MAARCRIEAHFMPGWHPRILLRTARFRSTMDTRWTVGTARPRWPRGCLRVVVRSALLGVGRDVAKQVDRRGGRCKGTLGPSRAAAVRVGRNNVCAALSHRVSGGGGRGRPGPQPVLTPAWHAPCSYPGHEDATWCDLLLAARSRPLLREKGRLSRLIGIPLSRYRRQRKLERTLQAHGSGSGPCHGFCGRSPAQRAPIGLLGRALSVHRHARGSAVFVRGPGPVTGFGFYLIQGSCGVR